MLVFVEGGKPENPEKNPQSKKRTNNKLKPHIIMASGGNRTQVTLVGGNRFNLCAIPAPLNQVFRSIMLHMNGVKFIPDQCFTELASTVERGKSKTKQ